MHLLMYACILPDLSYQFATQEYLGMLGWQGDVSGVPLSQVHSEEALFELRHGMMLARSKGTATLSWQPFVEDHNLWLRLEIFWNPVARLYTVNAMRTGQAAGRMLFQDPQQGLFDYTPQAVMLLDGDNRIYRVNPSFSEVTGFSYEDVVGQGPGIVTNREISAELFDHLWQQLMLRGFWEGELWNQHKDGHSYPAWYSLMARRDDSGEIDGFVAQFSDISSSYGDQNRYSHASYDALTGLPDEFMLLDQLNQQLLRDSLGHRGRGLLLLQLNSTGEAGGALIAALAARLSAQVRETDLLAMDQEHNFVFVLEDCPDEMTLEQFADRIGALLQEPVDIDGQPFVVHHTMGGVLVESGGISAELMLDRARLVLRTLEKQQGFWLYDKSLGSGTVLSRDTLGQAVSEGWLQLRFNPVYSLQEHHLAAAEVSLALNHPQQGILSPEQFIPQLSRYGLLQDYHQQLERQLLPMIKLWSGFEQFHNLCIRLQDEELFSVAVIEHLIRQMVKVGIPPQRLMIILNFVQLQLFPDEIEELKAHGVLILLDPQQHSLGRLSPQLFPDMLLLNAGLVEQQMRDDRYIRDVETLISMARQNDLEVMAEGVRTTGQMTRLTQQGCVRMSGKYVGRDLTLEQLVERLDLEH
ncbi:EAL domain-containing protein [Amphritea pacifica]|uniref:EAL domain-containing protein n=1 Tax=Amphritea pacifica TaxID=2811233 RepID=A0ABS2WA38_9GAMM|nr:EAL domain-containing protein [Amphritea pacifica]MBN0988446.1 EAL domain-containing protein [Amphritea pacifica]MBN1007916.1 EAL domain-containing protein [Amphritea pacifica]